MVSSGEEETEEPPPKRRRGAAKEFVLERRFPDAAAAVAWLKSSDFTVHKERRTAQGVKQDLRCKAGKAKSRWSP